MIFDWTLGLGLMATSVLAAAMGIGLLLALGQRPAQRGAGYLATDGAATALLFDGEVLVDSTPGGRALLTGNRLRGGAWTRMLAALAAPFPDLEGRLQHLASDGRLTLTSSAGDTPPVLLEAEVRGGLTRITLRTSAADGADTGRQHADPMAHRALTDELTQLRGAVAEAPVLIWRERADGETIWANAAYLSRATQTLLPGQDLSWPLPRLFDRIAGTQGQSGQRQRLDLAAGPLWFDLTSVPEGEGRLLFAMPADTAVQAEATLRDFMQTLTKTFAHLPIGLAIFDKQRQLQLFNPALLDLTGLPVDFLSLRPSLLSVLDAMRDSNMIPEPKDYRGWRKQLLDIEKAAASGLYEETWSLPGGQTYRVMGRPHPNGALALIIEDISTEMSRTRRFRADLELGQSVIDQVAEAIAVFSPAGQLVMSNTAYSDLWGHDPATSLGEAGVAMLAGHWRTLSSPNPIWSDVEDFVSTAGDRASWTGEARLLDGRFLGCRFSPLAGGATLVGFRVVSQGDSLPTRLTAARRA